MVSRIMLDQEKTPIKKGKATELSERVAESLMNLRQARGSSQRDFAEHLGISFQQYQKYEKARDRISLERAIVLCSKLGVSLDVFLDGIHGDVMGFAEQEQAAFGSTPKNAAKAAQSVEEQELLKLFRDVPKKSKKDFLDAVRQVAKITSGKTKTV